MLLLNPLLSRLPPRLRAPLRFAYRGRVGEPIPGAVLDAGIVRTVWMTPDEVRASVARDLLPAARPPASLDEGRRFLARRNHTIKQVAESDEWRRFLA